MYIHIFSTLCILCLFITYLFFFLTVYYQVQMSPIFPWDYHEGKITISTQQFLLCLPCWSSHRYHEKGGSFHTCTITYLSSLSTLTITFYFLFPLLQCNTLDINLDFLAYQLQAKFSDFRLREEFTASESSHYPLPPATQHLLCQGFQDILSTLQL